MSDLANTRSSVARLVNPGAERRRQARARHAVRLWGEVTLAGILVLCGLTVWHLKRRARLWHDRGAAPRKVEWPELEGDGRTMP